MATRKKTVEQQAQAMIKRHGRNAQMIAHHRADDTENPERHGYWEAVRHEIERIERGEPGVQP